MYIVVIAWMYVTLLMALAEESVVAGTLTFLFYGLAPLSLLLWLAGTPRRRRQRLALEDLEQARSSKVSEGLGPKDVLDKMVCQTDGRDSRSNE